MVGFYMGIGSGVTYPKVIELLEDAVRAKGQRAVSREAGVPLLGIQRYLKGNSKPTLETLLKLADYFGVSVAYLRGDDPAEYSDKTPLQTSLWLRSEVESRGVVGLAAATGVAVEDIERHLVGRGIPTNEVCAKFAEYSGKDPRWFRGLKVTRNIAGIGPDHETPVEDPESFASLDLVLLQVVGPGLKRALEKDVSKNNLFFGALYALARIVRTSPIGREVETLSDAEVLEIWRDAGAFLEKYADVIERKKQA